jgi:hypothetical protein
MPLAKAKKKSTQKKEEDLSHLAEQWDRLELEMGLRTKEEQDCEKERMEAHRAVRLRQEMVKLGKEEIREELKIANAKLTETENDERAYANAVDKLPEKEYEERAEKIRQDKLAYYNLIKKQHEYIEALWRVLHEKNGKD